MKKNNLLWLMMLVSTSTIAATQSTSSDPNAVHNVSRNASVASVEKAAPGEVRISFDEFDLDTSIIEQYRDQGIVFGGDSPFITSDSSNPTSPVLSGSPIFYGVIEGYFVKPGTDERAYVSKFSLDGGYFDEYGTVRVSIYDKDGKLVNQQIAKSIGIQKFEFEGSIHRFRIEAIADEPSGFAIDNVTFIISGSSIVFREKSDKFDPESFWSFVDDEVPGYDHVGFNYNGEVFESHPGYTPGTYYAENGEQTEVQQINGVQKEHSKGSFDYYSKTEGSSKVIHTNEIDVSSELAGLMAAASDQAIAQGAEFSYIAADNFNFEVVEQILSPSKQKGGDNSFTCVGLVEWAAEQAGHRNGAGFIDDKYEVFELTVPEFNGWDSLPSLRTYQLPMLSPMWLEHIMLYGQQEGGISDWALGWFDPVDVIVTDPLGRRLGSIGNEVFEEIPGGFVTPNGFIDMIAIPEPLPGDYQVSFHGLGEKATGAFNIGGRSIAINQMLEEGETVIENIFVEPQGDFLTRVDVNADGLFDQGDVVELENKVGVFTDGLFAVGDLNSNGEYDLTDVQLLSDLLPTLDKVFISEDVNRDGSVDDADGMIIASVLNRCEGDTTYIAEADINIDSCVDWRDYISWWFEAHQDNGVLPEPNVMFASSGAEVDVNSTFKVTLSVSEMVLGVSGMLQYSTSEVRLEEVSVSSDYLFKTEEVSEGVIRVIASTLNKPEVDGEMALITLSFTMLSSTGADISFTSSGENNEGLVTNSVTNLDMSTKVSVSQPELVTPKESAGGGSFGMFWLTLLGLLVTREKSELT
jgi:hypothetical protein